MGFIDIDISTKTWFALSGMVANDVRDPWHQHFEGYFKVLLELD
jgi:hypothetical protein